MRQFVVTQAPAQTEDTTRSLQRAPGMKTTGLAPTLEAACRRWSERPALSYRDTTLSFADLWAKVVALAGAYEDLGIRHGDRIICQLPTSPEHLIAANAAWLSGAVHVGADRDLTGRELSELARMTEAPALLFRPEPASPDPLAPLRAVAEASPRTRIIIDASTNVAGTPTLSSLLATARRRRETEARFAYGVDDPALLFLTSGTTGASKAVIETLPALWAKLAYFAEAMAPAEDDVHLIYLPISHAFGFKLSMTALLSGGRVLLMDRFSPETALGLITAEGVTILPGTPTHFQILLSTFDPAHHSAHALRWAVSAAAPLRPALVEQLYDVFGVEMFHVYGCSEGFLVTTTDRSEILRGSAGRRVFTSLPDAPPTGTVVILDEQGHQVPPGEVGEIVFGTAKPIRYWRSQSVGLDGCYRTGDLGRMDEDGCVFVVGRLKDLINRGGLKVAPGEVEAFLVKHVGVAEAAVVGTPHRVLGEAICACIVPSGDPPPTLADVRAFLEESLARHKLPDELCVVQEIPRTKVGKVDRPALLQLVLSAGDERERLRA